MKKGYASDQGVIRGAIRRSRSTIRRPGKWRGEVWRGGNSFIAPHRQLYVVKVTYVAGGGGL